MSEWQDRASTTAGEAPAGGYRNNAEGRGVFGEFVEAAREAMVSLLDEQKERAAERVAAVGDAVRRAGQSLDSSQTPTIARYASRTAGQIDEVSAGIKERRWSELGTDIAEFARRRPGVFVAAAAALGFAAGRLAASPPHTVATPSFAEPVTPPPSGLATPTGPATAGTVPGTPPDVP